MNNNPLKEITDVTISQSTYVYTGDEKKPKETVKWNGTVLTLNTDYIVTYSNNVNVGTAKVIITGIGDYMGTVEKPFTITNVSINSRNIISSRYGVYRKC